MVKTVSDHVVDYLYEIGVRYVFGITGGGAAGLNNAFAKSKIKYISFHHEQGAANAAIGYAKQTGKLAVVNPTTGCGSTNCVTSVLDAWQDSVPVLFLSGNVPLQQTTEWLEKYKSIRLRQYGIQENNIIELIKPITKFSMMLYNTEHSLRCVKQAINIATSARKGPVWIDVPGNVQNEILDYKQLSPHIETLNIENCLCSTDRDLIDSRLKTSKYPLILIGNGIHLSNTKSQLIELVNRYQVPVVSTYLGIDLLDSSSNLYIGSIGVKGSRAGNFAINNCDFLLVLGCSLNVAEIGYDASQFAPNADIYVVDMEEKKQIKSSFIQCNLTNFFKDLL